MSRVGEAVARQVGAKLCLMVDLEEKEKVVFSFSNNKSDMHVSQTIVSQTQILVLESPVIEYVPHSR